SGMDELFSLDPAPTAAIVGDEVAANELFRRCYKRNIRVPEDLSMVALSDSAPHTHPVELSAPDSVRWIHDLSSQAGIHLQKLIDGEAPPCTSTLMAPPIQWRESVVDQSENSLEDELKNEILTNDIEPVASTSSSPL